MRGLISYLTEILLKYFLEESFTVETVYSVSDDIKFFR